jgi:hypothetical protein
MKFKFRKIYFLNARYEYKAFVRHHWFPWALCPIKDKEHVSITLDKR